MRWTATEKTQKQLIQDWAQLDAEQNVSKMAWVYVANEKEYWYKLPNGEIHRREWNGSERL